MGLIEDAHLPVPEDSLVRQATITAMVFEHSCTWTVLVDAGHSPRHVSGCSAWANHTLTDTFPGYDVARAELIGKLIPRDRASVARR